MKASTKPPVAPEPLFREEQRFRQPWVWTLMSGALAVTAAPLAVQLYEEAGGEGSWQRLLADHAEAATSAGIGVAVVAGVAGLMAALKLIVEVHSDRLYVRFWPFQSREIPLADVERADRVARTMAVTYHPVGDYGGWGIRFGGSKGKAYNVSGDRGVRLTFAGGKPLLIGSQRADELAAAIQQAQHGPQ